VVRQLAVFASLYAVYAIIPAVPRTTAHCQWIAMCSRAKPSDARSPTISHCTDRTLTTKLHTACLAQASTPAFVHHDHGPDERAARASTRAGKLKKNVCKRRDGDRPCTPPLAPKTKMRPLTDEETGQVFAKLDKFIGKEGISHLIDRKDEPFVFRLNKHRVFYISESQLKQVTSFSRETLLAAGICVGKVRWLVSRAVCVCVCLGHGGLRRQSLVYAFGQVPNHDSLHRRARTVRQAQSLAQA